MIFLIGSIIVSTGLFVIFKLFGKFNINSLHAIVVNYFIAGISGLLHYNKTITASTLVSKPWFYGTIILGILFIAVFYLMATTTQKNGLSTASVASKMSVVIPIGIGIFAFNENAGIQKIIGITLAIIAVYLTASKPGKHKSANQSMLFPVLLFCGAGIIDSTINYIQTHHMPTSETALFSASTFFVAGLSGVTIILATLKKQDFSKIKQSIIGGIILGAVNFYSLFFIIKSLQIQYLESSTVFTINNVSIVTLSTLLGVLYFKERLLLKNKIGVALAIISIILVTTTI
ncbi:EamA family transporter [Mangrovimonas aestuarii]|uniref:EamA family transporter n=1 Tax=Mangrovimonas aestuarii TaxID=3018443 RepID=UPI00237966ED|nr:EamA family transporter [Mangrovimonas aestuarii]